MAISYMIRFFNLTEGGMITTIVSASNPTEAVEKAEKQIKEKKIESQFASIKVIKFKMK